MPPDEQLSAERRVIKRYSNRKLYDTTDSRYVTLQQIGEMVRCGDDVQIIDNKTKEDKTEATLALILSEDLKNKPRSVPLGTLRTLIQERGGKVLSSLRGGPLGRFMPSGEEGALDEEHPEAAPPAETLSVEEDTLGSLEDSDDKRNKLGELVETSRQQLDHLQFVLDERVKAVVPGLGTIRELREEVASLTRRVEAIERHLGLSRPDDEGN